MKKIAIIPPMGNYFDLLFSENNPFYAPGISKKVEYLIRKDLAEKGYQFISTQPDSFLGNDVIAVIHWAVLCPTVIRYNPDKIHIFLSHEPFQLYNTATSIKKIGAILDYCITLFEDTASGADWAYAIPGCYNFDVSFQPLEPAQRPLLLSTVGGDKETLFRNELYSQRREVIRWFEANCPDRFAFGGTGWKQDYQAYQSYGGRVACKLEFLSKAKFALCFENCYDREGYVSEKLFDAMFAGSIPVYWGAKNIAELVPADLYIDYRKVGTPEKLFTLLNNMSDDEINAYRARIAAWLKSDGVEKFSYRRWEEQLLRCIEQGKRVRPDSRMCKIATEKMKFVARAGILAQVRRKFAK